MLNEVKSPDVPTFILAKPVPGVPEGLCPKSRSVKNDSIKFEREEFKPLQEFKTLPRLGY